MRSHGWELIWRGAREAEGARLEIVCTPKRCTVGSNPTLSAKFFLEYNKLIAGSCATKPCEPRQVREEATAVGPFVCRRGAWLSFFSREQLTLIHVLFSPCQKMAPSDI